MLYKFCSPVKPGDRKAGAAVRCIGADIGQGAMTSSKRSPTQTLEVLRLSHGASLYSVFCSPALLKIENKPSKTNLWITMHDGKHPWKLTSTVLVYELIQKFGDVISERRNGFLWLWAMQLCPNPQKMNSLTCCPVIALTPGFSLYAVNVCKGSMHIYSCPTIWATDLSIYTANPFWFFSCEEADGPYAWRYMVGAGGASICPKKRPMPLKSFGAPLPMTSKLAEVSVFEGGPKWKECLPSDMLAQPDLEAIIREAAAHDCIAFKLPKVGSLAGTVLAHSIRVVENLFDKHSPLTFKFGYTHDAHWRWSNDLYGYKMALEKWASMIVLYISSEPFGPAMLEATLIEKYGSTLLAYILNG